jgi:meromycolic acid enoyl-[acyl-carrier protein] reductase
VGLLDGKRILITGVLTDASIAFNVAKVAEEQGAEILLTGAGRALRLTKRTARKLQSDPPVLELDVGNQEHLDALTADLTERWGQVDGVLHSIGFAPESCLGGGFMDAPWEDVAVAMHISAYSLKALAAAVHPLMKENGGSILSLTFDARMSWPVYDWMGVAKAALESCSRYLAKELGPDNIRVNTVAAGPIKTIAARSIPGFETIDAAWSERSPIFWDTGDSMPVAKSVVALMSDWFPSTTGEMIHVDGGLHSTGG